MNLLSNAMKYTPDDGSILVRVEQKGDHAEIAVSDSGRGIDDKDKKHIFERFYRVDKGRSRKLGGTGLGLAIVKNAVAVHGGKTTAQLTPGGGLTIRFTLARF